MNEATDVDMLAAVERWARATDRWHSDASWAKGHWFVFVAGSECDLRGQGPVCLRCGPSPDDGRWYVDPHTALVWALFMEAGLPLVDVGKCPACEGNGVQHYSKVNPNAPWPESRRYDWLPGGGPEWCAHQACPACPPAKVNTKPAAKRAIWAGTGRELRSPAHLLLDAAPRPSTDLVKPAKYGRAKCRGCGYAIATTRAGLIRSHTGGPGPRCSGSKQLPDTGARDHLAVLADRLQSEGVPLGEWLALWLADKRDGTADMIERRIFNDNGVICYGLVPAGVRLANEVDPLTLEFVASYSGAGKRGLQYAERYG